MPCPSGSHRNLRSRLIAMRLRPDPTYRFPCRRVSDPGARRRWHAPPRHRQPGHPLRAYARIGPSPRAGVARRVRHRLGSAPREDRVDRSPQPVSIDFGGARDHHDVDEILDARAGPTPRRPTRARAPVLRTRRRSRPVRRAGPPEPRYLPIARLHRGDHRLMHSARS
jgi:hypothetical protein